MDTLLFTVILIVLIAIVKLGISSPKFWIQFDKPKEPGLWISDEIEKLVN